jgi:hypothetical protein
MKRPILGALLGALTAGAFAVTPALAAEAGSVTTGQTTTFNVPASPNGFSQSWSFTYPGDSSNLTVDAELGGYDPSFATAIGFKVFDSQHQVGPVETATTQSNMKTNDAHGIEFNYSAGTPGPVTIQFFSYAPIPLQVTLTQSGLVGLNSGSGNTVTPITLQAPGGSGGAPAAASGASSPAAPGATTPAPAPAGAGLATGQTATFNVPASPNGFSKVWTFSYPGDNSNIIFDSDIGGYDPSFATAIGYKVFDAQHQAAPLETATTQSNQRHEDPHGIEFVYSSGTPGTVTIQFFSYAPAAVDMTLTQSGLIGANTGNGSTVTPVTLQPIS